MTDAPLLIVVGDALLDVHVAPRDPVRRGSDVPAAIRLGPGGQGANVAARLARRSVPVRLVCALADDAAGRVVRHALERDGVDLQELPASSTGSVVVLGEGGGERTMLSDRAPLAAALATADLPPAAWTAVSGYLLAERDAAPAAARLAASGARRALLGCAVADDDLAGWMEAARLLRPDLVILNREEADRVAALDRFDGVVITDADGASARAGGVTASVSVAGGGPVVDTTGAGDAFAAALLHALAGASWPPDEPALRAALEDGAALGSAVARVAGAQAVVAGERPVG